AHEAGQDAARLDRSVQQRGPRRARGERDEGARDHPGIPPRAAGRKEDRRDRTPRHRTDRCQRTTGNEASDAEGHRGDEGPRGAELRISGDASAVARVGDLVGAMRTLSSRDQSLRKPQLERLIEDAKDASIGTPSELREVVATTVRGKRISPQSVNQRTYVEAIRRYDLAFAIGP